MVYSKYPDICQIYCTWPSQYNHPRNYRPFTECPTVEITKLTPFELDYKIGGDYKLTEGQSAKGSINLLDLNNSSYKLESDSIRIFNSYIPVNYIHPTYGQLTYSALYRTECPNFISKKITVKETTETTCEMEITVCDGFEDHDLKISIWSNTDKRYRYPEHIEKNKWRITSLLPDRDYDFRFSVYGNSHSFDLCYNAVFAKTKSVVLDFHDIEVTPTSIRATPYISLGDAEQYATTKMEFNGYEYETVENEIFESGLRNIKNNNYYSFSLSSSILGMNYVGERTVKLPALELETVAARATSNDCAIICAKTNVSDYETGMGFEYRRYDAPDLVPSTEVFCPVYDGMMAGKLKGLSSNTYYKYRPFYEDRSGKRTYGDWTAFGTADAYVYFEPTVYTYEPRSVTASAARVTGYALPGSDDITEQGFEYWPTSAPVSRSQGGPMRIQAAGQRMTAELTELLPKTEYSLRAYAVTSKGEVFGETRTFTTAALPVIEDPDDPDDAIEEAEAAPTTYDVYNLQGVCVSRNAESLSGLAPGIYIVRQGNKTYKTVIR